jgi:hypothetical protein
MERDNKHIKVMNSKGKKKKIQQQKLHNIGIGMSLHNHEESNLNNTRFMLLVKVFA